MTDLELIKKGFNAGYLLEKYDPELAKKIFSSLKDQDIPYAKGYIAGSKEFQIEKTLEKSDLYPGMDEDFDIDVSKKDLDKNRDRGKDDFDIDI